MCFTVFVFVFVPEKINMQVKNGALGLAFVNVWYNGSHTIDTRRGFDSVLIPCPCVQGTEITKTLISSKSQCITRSLPKYFNQTVNRILRRTESTTYDARISFE